MLQNEHGTQWDKARQISLIFVRDIWKSVGCVIIRFLRNYRLTDDDYRPSGQKSLVRKGYNFLRG